MTRILSSIFYISSMRKTSQKFNSDTVIQNIWQLSGEDMTVEELPYWETINKYLERLEPQELQDVIHKLVRKLLRSRAFEDARIRGKYWQIIIDGMQIYSSREKLDEKSLYWVHNRGTEAEYAEYYYYVLEAKVVLHPDVIVSIMTEFVENTDGKEAGKQDCERKACYRLMDRLKKEFPHLPICLNADSLYACENFFLKCQENGRHYILSFKDGSIPTIADEFGRIRKIEGNRQEQAVDGGICWHDFVTEIDYNGYGINIAEYVEERHMETKSGPVKGELKEVRSKFVYITDLPVSKKKRGGVGGGGKAALENRKSRVQHTKTAWVLPGTFIQQKLPGNEKPLFPNADRAYDIPSDGGMGEALEEGRPGPEGEA